MNLMNITRNFLQKNKLQYSIMKNKFMECLFYGTLKDILCLWVENFVYKK